MKVIAKKDNDCSTATHHSSREQAAAPFNILLTFFSFEVACVATWVAEGASCEGGTTCEGEGARWESTQL